MASAGVARVWVMVVTGLATVGLVMVAVLTDLNTAGQAASMVGAVAGLAAFLFMLLRDGGASGGRRVRAGRGGIAAGGDITGSALGKNSKVAGPHTAQRSSSTRRGGGDVRAGRDGVAAGGDITDSALGEGSER
ncbi:hypothetical protein ACFYXM_34945 [Streptomyces sp. NPDC002476]|uniref:hypothetical protein n=1 Tax=Streptomyces sp. NPDC002476 TaxID=3364648 RepID=UPI0036D0CF47